jgi:hypothetical protein
MRWETLGVFAVAGLIAASIGHANCVVWDNPNCTSTGVGFCSGQVTLCDGCYKATAGAGKQFTNPQTIPSFCDTYEVGDTTKVDCFAAAEGTNECYDGDGTCCVVLGNASPISTKQNGNCSSGGGSYTACNGMAP